MNTQNTTDSEALRDYERLATECLGSNALENMRVSQVVSVTERGTTLRLENSTASFAFKFVQASPDSSYPRAMIENEAAILRQIPDHTRNLLVTDGCTEERAWVMTRWQEGPSAGRLARQLRQSRSEQNEDDATETRHALLTLIAAVFRTVSALHEKGYNHGDIQPAHLIDAREPQFALIDFGLARRRGQVGIPYRGALVHFAAPEIASGMRDGATDIPYDVLSEVYSVASVAFQLYTGYPTTDYTGDDGKAVPFREMLSRIAEGGSATRRTFASTGAPVFPELERVLESCLLWDRRDRCASLDSAVHALQALD